MEHLVSVEMPGPPRGKGRPRFSTRGGFVKTYTDAKTREYEDGLKRMAKWTMGDRPPFEGPLRLLVLAEFPIAASWPRAKKEAALDGELAHTSKPDVDNIVKIVDALNEVVWLDDSQIVECYVSKRYGNNPRLRLDVFGRHN